MNIIGRKAERAELDKIYRADGPRFVAIYGRRRVGKTFLIKEHFKEKLTFWHTGLSPYDRDKKFLLRDQLQAFYYSLQDYGLHGTACPQSWLESFRLLETLLKQKDDGSRQVVFIDEMPWMDTARSRFIPALEYFWNGWASKRDNVVLIVCGSATSWIEDNLINNKGGLYNRLTDEIKLSPFTLAECEQFFKDKGISMSRYDLAQSYMVFGGIPHYLSLFEKGMSIPQNIDRILFDKNAKLRNEFERLFGSLFKNSEDYIDVVRLLSKRRSGYTRQEIIQHTGLKAGGGVTLILKGLIESDFIASYYPFGEKRREKYRLVDPYCLFYLSFIDQQAKLDPNYWQKNFNTPRLNSWRGHAFEELCFSQIDKIKQKLSIGGVSTTESSWIVNGDDDNKMQIDMLINRSDNVINLCEIKFYRSAFSIDKQYDAVLRERVQRLIEKVPKKKTVHLTVIAAFGLKVNEYSSQVQSVVTLDDLF
ncbi:MAG: ATP-binding protein [Muribaculaceae bacterium]|nr:ATP-binding protein [Muribaculaceae bacterium]